MESYSVPLRALANHLAWFIRAREIRVLNILSSADLRDSVLDLVAGFEYHADNHSPFVRLEEPFVADDSGWLARTQSLRTQHDARVKAMSKNGYALGTIRPATRTTDTPLGGFAALLVDIVQANCAPLSGALVLLGPRVVDPSGQWERDLVTLLETPKLRDVRFVVVDVDRSSVPGIVTRLRGSATQTTVRVDEEAARRDLAQQIEGATAAGADAPGAAQVGAAWPRDALPPAKGAPALSTAARAALATKLGVAPGLLGDDIRNVRPLVLKAAAALRGGNAVEAVRSQREACDCALKAGLVREATLMEIVLATYVVHAGERTRAMEIYNVCAVRAEKNGWADLAAQALMAVAALLLLDRHRDRAAVTYVRAGTVARDGKEVPLAIEAFRMAGQLRAEAKDEQQAIQLFSQAIEIAGGLELPDAAQTSAPLAARTLAAVCRRRGLTEQARSLEDLGNRMEAP